NSTKARCRRTGSASWNGAASRYAAMSCATRHGRSSSCIERRLAPAIEIHGLPALQHDAPLNSAAHSLLAYCRPGFESECAQELAARDAALATGGFARSVRDSGFVEFVLADRVAADTFAGEVRLRDLCFSRQLLRVIGRVEDLPKADRLARLLPLIRERGRRFCDAWIESPDSDAARELAGLCRSLNNA